MSNILISVPPTSLLTGLLQLSGGVAISSTPVYVTDQNNTASPLALATTSVGINTTSGTSLINIKGTGASSSTSSMTIKDNTGANIFKFNDNGAMSIGLNSNPSTTANSLVVGLTTTNDQLTITSTQLSTSLNTLKLQSGGFTGTYIQANSVNDCVQVGNSGFGVNATPTSGTQRVVFKGWGSTGATTSLLVQNSSSSQLLSILDDGTTYLGNGSAYFRILQNGNDSYIQKSNYATGRMIFTGDSVSTLTGGVLFDTTKFGINTGTTTATANLEVRGAITTNVLKLVNSADTTQYFSAYLSSAPNLWDIGPLADDGNTILRMYRNNYIVTRINSTEYMRQESNGVGFFTGGSAPTARLQVKGSGSTSATTSLLVQNSSSTQMFKITDDGTIEGGGATSTQFKVMNQGGLAISRDASFDANIRIREFGAGSGPAFKMNGNSTPTFKMVDASNFNCITSWSDWTGTGKSTIENSSACLQSDSTSRGWLPPRMTTAQKLAITTPASGLMVYDTTLNQMSYYNSVTWINF